MAAEEKRGRAIPLAMLLGGLLAALVLGELALRLLRPAQLAVVRYPCIYQPDPQLGFRYTPGATGLVAAHFEIENPVEINSLGFYDDELGPADAFPRVLALGDSFTAAMNVTKAQLWTSVLERALREAGHPRADVVNLGLDGTGTDVHVELLREYLPRFRPQIVVLAFFANDVADVIRGRFERECYQGYVLSYQTPAQRDALRATLDAHRAKPIRRWLFEHSYWVRLVGASLLPRASPYRLQFQQPRLAELGPAARDQAAGLRRYAAALRALEELAASCACRLLVVPVPPRGDAQASLGRWKRRTTRHDFGHDFELVDLLPALERARQELGVAHEALYFEHDNHLNTLGNRLFGEALAEVLLKHLRTADL